jgi:hypothetical protein
MILVNEMLDKLPNGVWKNKNLKWFDPATGIGNFTIAVYFRLMEGLKEEIINFKEIKKVDDAEKYLENELLTSLKCISLYMLKLHIALKKSDQTASRITSQSIDRNKTIEFISSRLDNLMNERDMYKAAEIIISIQERIDNHVSVHSSDARYFVTDEYIKVYDRIIRTAIEIKAASIVLKFAKTNILMLLSDKNIDGKEITVIYKRINKYIEEFFGKEAEINNTLLNNVNNVYEPKRKTSNIKLYNLLRFIKLGENAMRREYKISIEEIEEFRDILNKIYDQYISGQSKITTEPDEYLYTGVDEVKLTGEDRKPESGRKVQEVYVRMDLVNADSFEKSSKASCKLLDKELAQEFLYLADPLNKNNKTLSRYRDLDFESVAKNPMNTAAEAVKPEEVKTATNPLPVVKTNGGKSQKIYRHWLPENRRKTARYNKMT